MLESILTPVNSECVLCWVSQASRKLKESSSPWRVVAFVACSYICSAVVPAFEASRPHDVNAGAEPLKPPPRTVLTSCGRSKVYTCYTRSQCTRILDSRKRGMLLPSSWTARHCHESIESSSLCGEIDGLAAPPHPRTRVRYIEQATSSRLQLARVRLFTYGVGTEVSQAAIVPFNEYVCTPTCIPSLGR
jgi:hypothetical protein